ncbi:hypothetical protein PG990_001970 [Apiospora arundinis]|uniref:Uncharacterized protein n=1 Tax=Apiospora arundinis TaxID=335852 RepID=A0ABR2I4F2_9PEZI
MAFLEDPRLRQRWNQISQTTETVTENAAAGIWTFGHTYLNPCLGSICSAFDGCAACCLGDHEERARRRRERERARGNAEYSFDFYDDWDDDLAGEGGGQGSGGGGGIFKGWHHEDWDRLLAGTGTSKKGPGEIHEQPQSSKRGMSYGTREARRKSSTAEDPTIIPSTQPIGFLGRLPFKFGGPLRYKPSAANLQEHPGRHGLEGEHEPLLGGADDHHEAHFMVSPTHSRKRSGTTGSGDTSDSYRSRGDLFPSDGEGDEDAIPLDDEFADEFAVALDRVASTDDRSSNKTRSSKGKRKASSAYSVQRSASRTTLGSTYSRHSSSMLHQTPELAIPQVAEPSVIEDLQYEEEQLRQQEDEEIERKRQAAAQLALERGLHRDNVQVESVPEAKAEMVEVDDMYAPEQAAEVLTVEYSPPPSPELRQTQPRPQSPTPPPPPSDDFVPARLPYFN